MNDTDWQERYGSFGHLGEHHLAPIGPIAIIASQLDPTFSDQLNYHMRRLRSQHVKQAPGLDHTPGYLRSDYRVATDLSRFDTGEGKAAILNTVRGHDLFIVTDVLNYGQHYQRHQHTTSKAPDEHFSDLMRMVQACRAAARRINVVLPYLYEGRRYRRTGRQSLDAALALKALFALRVDNVITFDAHDSRVANAVPRSNFETCPTSLPLLDGLLSAYPDLPIAGDRLTVVSPDEVSISRCIFYASTLKAPLGVFYRRRAYSREHNGTVIANHETCYLGDSVKDRDVLIVDDAIHTGHTMLRCAEQLKAEGARRVICAATFATFTNGFEPFNQAYDRGVIDRVIATNLTYAPHVVQNAPWFWRVDMSKHLAGLIDALNHNASLSSLLAPSGQIEQRLKRHRDAQTHRVQNTTGGV